MLSFHMVDWTLNPSKDFSSVVNRVLLRKIDDLMVSRHTTCLAVGLIIQGLGICGIKGFVLGSFRSGISLTMETCNTWN